MPEGGGIETPNGGAETRSNETAADLAAPAERPWDAPHAATTIASAAAADPRGNQRNRPRCFMPWATSPGETQAVDRAHDLLFGVVADQLDLHALVVDRGLKAARNPNPADQTPKMRGLGRLRPLADQPVAGRPSPKRCRGMADTQMGSAWARSHSAWTAARASGSAEQSEVIASPTYPNHDKRFVLVR